MGGGPVRRFATKSGGTPKVRRRAWCALAGLATLPRPARTWACHPDGGLRKVRGARPFVESHGHADVAMAPEETWKVAEGRSF
jgi:hypothetical protein